MVKAFYISLIYLIFTTAAWAQVTAQVNRTELYDDEAVLLTVTISPKGQLNPDDVRALESLFNIEQRFQSERSQIINGNRTSSVEYQFRLSPKQTGTLGIPNFRVNGEQSQPVFINVLDSSLRKDNLADDAVIFNASLSKTTAYIDQPIQLELEIGLKIAVQNGNFTNLNDLGFELSVLNNTQTQETINGQPYNVYRFTYEFTPKSAGAYSIPPIKFGAEYPNQNLGRYVKFTRTAKLPSLVVKNIPESYPAGAYWLPLEQLTLTDNLNATIIVEQNEHLDWQLIQTAKGTTANNLPDVLKLIESSLDSNIKLYKNSPQLEDNTRQDSAAISFVTAGEYELPAVRIPWWNTTTDSLAWAEIPKRQVTVSPAQANTFVQNTTATPLTESPEPEVIIQETSPTWKIATLVSVLGWVLTLLYFLLWNRPKGVTEVEAIEASKTADNLNDAYQKYLAALQATNLTTAQLHPELTEGEVKTLEQLEQHLFAGSDEEPDLKDVNVILRKISGFRGKGNNETKSRYSLYP